MPGLWMPCQGLNSRNADKHAEWLKDAKASVLETVDRSWNSSSSSYECIAGERIDPHDRTASEQTSKFGSIAYIFPNYGDDAHCGGFLIDHADCHLIGDDA